MGTGKRRTQNCRDGENFSHFPCNQKGFDFSSAVVIVVTLAHAIGILINVISQFHRDAQYMRDWFE